MSVVHALETSKDVAGCGSILSLLDGGHYALLTFGRDQSNFTDLDPGCPQHRRLITTSVRSSGVTRIGAGTPEVTGKVSHSNSRLWISRNSEGLRWVRACKN